MHINVEKVKKCGKIDLKKRFWIEVIDTIF